LATVSKFRSSQRPFYTHVSKSIIHTEREEEDVEKTYSQMLECYSAARKIKLLILRHAQSESNEKVTQLESTSASVEDLTKLKFSNLAFVDAVLSQNGQHQCSKFSEKLISKHPKLKYVLISPMRRTVQTALKITKGYPTPLEYVVIPHLREVLSQQADIGYYSVDFLKDYAFIDTSLLPKHNLWFLDCYEDILEDHYGKRIREQYEKKAEPETIMSFMSLHYPNIERPAQTILRVKKAKELIRDFIRKKEEKGVHVEDDQILIISHSRTLRFFCGVYDNEGQAIEGANIGFPHCKLRSHYLSYH